MSAAWLEGLSEEWREPSDEAENITSSSDGRGEAAPPPPPPQSCTMDFGSIVVKDPTPYRGGISAPVARAADASGMGTTILHGVQENVAESSIVEQHQDGSIVQYSAPGSFIQRSSPKKSIAAAFARTPSGSLSNNNNQLAWAISAFTKGNGNLLAEQTPKTPNRLQMLFIDAASPTPLTVVHADAGAAASMTDALPDGGEEAAGEDVQETPTQDEGDMAAQDKQQESDQTEEATSNDQSQPEEAEEEQGERARSCDC